MSVGAVANLRRIKDVVSIAKHVLQHTKHSMLIGDHATTFVVGMGFQEKKLSTNISIGIWQDWKDQNCQPNYWKNVEPDPSSSCGPYTPINESSVYFEQPLRIDAELSHDTIGMVVTDNDDNIIAGTSTNWLRHKIPGRVGDSPIPGAGAYADNDVGGASATGDGDTLMTFLPSFLAVEQMRRGFSPEDATQETVARIAKHYPTFSGGVIAVNKIFRCNG